MAPLTDDKTPSQPVTLQTVMMFCAQYEALVEVLCDGATYGPEPRLSAHYERIRTWMMQNYPHIQTELNSRLESSAAPRWEISRDPFEELFSPNTLEAFLATDDGQMIQRILSTRHAIDELTSDLRAAG
ncbi:MAG: hypothetical protein JNJ45_04710 [Chthonomonas sp.]|nr:hypothetical protein [Chthonomonas sp.]